MVRGHWTHVDRARATPKRARAPLCIYDLHISQIEGTMPRRREGEQPLILETPPPPPSCTLHHQTSAAANAHRITSYKCGRYTYNEQTFFTFSCFRDLYRRHPHGSSHPAVGLRRRCIYRRRVSFTQELDSTSSSTIC